MKYLTNERLNDFLFLLGSSWPYDQIIHNKEMQFSNRNTNIITDNEFIISHITNVKHAIVIWMEISKLSIRFTTGWHISTHFIRSNQR